MSSAKPYLILMVLAFVIVAGAMGMAQTWQIKFVPLWTDILIYVLVFSVAWFGIQARQKEHLRAPWRHVLQRPLAMSALVVLMFYVVIGLLDSIHFREALQQEEGQTELHYSGDVLTVFDKLVTPLRTRQEKTYSAPFASHLYAKETIETNAGQVRDFPRLKYGGQHLTDPALDFWLDLIKGTAFSLAYSMMFWLVVSAVITGLAARHYKKSSGIMLGEIAAGKTRVPFRPMLLTFWVLCFLAAFIIVFADKYHILGTDKVGNDVLYYSLKSIRTGLVIGTLTTLIMLPFAVMLGIRLGNAF